MLKLLPCVFLLLAGPRVLAQQPTDKAKPETELLITTSMKSQATCIDANVQTYSEPVGWGTTSEVKIKLKLVTRYLNVGRQPIILDKGSGYISLYRIAHAPDAGRYEREQFYEPIVIGESEAEGAAPSNAFVILKRGQSWEGTSEVDIILNHLQYQRHYSGTKHYLSFFLWTQSGPRGKGDEVEDLRRRWLKFGYLWTKGVYSLPMPIDFQNVAGMSQCQH